jgi:cell division protein FtsL
VKRRGNPFLTLWTLAILAATAAFVLYLGLRVRSVELGYELGRAHARVARLREVKRVLELELASHKTPERVELVARSLLGMSEPTADRILPAGEQPVDEESKADKTAPQSDEASQEDTRPAAGATAPATAPTLTTPAAGSPPASAPPDDGSEYQDE